MPKKLKPDINPRKHSLRLFEHLPELSGPIIRICSNKEVSIDGCKGVIDYREEFIKLRIAGGSVTFSGSGLTMTAFTESSAVISGKLQNVEFSVM